MTHITHAPIVDRGIHAERFTVHDRSIDVIVCSLPVPIIVDKCVAFYEQQIFNPNYAGNFVHDGVRSEYAVSQQCVRESLTRGLLAQYREDVGCVCLGAHIPSAPRGPVGMTLYREEISEFQIVIGTSIPVEGCNDTYIGIPGAHVIKYTFGDNIREPYEEEVAFLNSLSDAK